MNCGDLFVPNQDKGFGTEMAEEGVENLGKLSFCELVETRAADLRTVEQALVGGFTHGVELLVKADGETEVVEAVLHSLRADAGGKLLERGVAGGIVIQRLHMELIDCAMAPLAAGTDLLLVTEEFVKACEGGGEGVLTILYDECSFLNSGGSAVCV